MSQATAPSRLRASPKVKDPPRPTRAKSVSPDVSDNSKRTRSLLLTKPKSKSGELAQKGREIEEFKEVGRARNRPAVERFARPRRQTPAEVVSKKNEENPDRKNQELVDKLETSEVLIKNLQGEVLSLKEELDKAQGLNFELQRQNKKLEGELAAAEAKIASLSSCDQREEGGEYQSSKFKDIQKLIANKLERTVGKKEVVGEVKIGRKLSPPPPPPPPPPMVASPGVASSERKAAPPPPLPPPPPPPRSSARAPTHQRAPALVDFYHSLTKKEVKRESKGLDNRNKQAAISAHSSIVGEIQNRSAHLIAIRADIESKGEFINGLITKVEAAAYMDIEDVLNFVDWIDRELSSLADERAVLKHFKWPERKADALREAAVEYRELKLLECEISSFKDDTDIPCAAALKKMASLLDKSERGIQRLIKLRNSALRSYQEFKIPTGWMLDTGLMSKIKQASMNLVKMFMKRVTLELESIQNSDRESNQESLLLQGVNFAYRAHQFAGGLDSETLCAFEEIRQRFPGNMGSSRELFAGIPSS